jgi:hypothetical protein
MKCSGCKFYKKSKVYGNHCICMGTKPCDVDRNNKISKHYKKERTKRKQKFNYEQEI